MENSVEFPQNIKNVIALWPSDSTSENISIETHNTNSKEHMHPHVQCSIIYISQGLEAAQVSISDDWIKKAVAHLHNEILLGCKKEGNPVVTAWMDLEDIMLSEISQSEKDKCHVTSLICGI